VPPLNAPAAIRATADVDVELADPRTAGDFGRKLGGDVGLADGATTLGTGVRQGRLEDFIDRRGVGG